MPVRDERWLQMRHRCWYVVREIPKALRSQFGGKRRLIQSLKTDNLTLAQARRHRVLAEWQKQFDAARAPKAHNDMVSAALMWREHAAAQVIERPDLAHDIPRIGLRVVLDRDGPHRPG